MNDRIKLTEITKDDLKLINADGDSNLLEKIYKYKLIDKNNTIIVVACAILTVIMYALKSWGLMILFGIGFVAQITVLTNTKEEIRDTINQYTKKQMLEDMRKKEIYKNRDELQEEYNKLREKNKILSIERVNRKLQYLHEFRRNHYNIKIEKLLIDVGFSEECKRHDYRYNSINKNDIIKEGTYEDYFYLFNNFENEYSEHEQSNTESIT